MMLDPRGDDPVRARVALARHGRASDGQVVRFATAGSKDNLVGAAMQSSRNLLARRFNGGFGALTIPVDRGRVPEHFGEIRPHGFHHTGIDGRGSGIIKINQFRHFLPLCQRLYLFGAPVPLRGIVHEKNGKGVSYRDDIPYRNDIIPPAMDLNVAGHQTGGYTVTTPVYAGPLDLLLQLIEHAELDITSVALAQVTDQYLAYIHQMQVPADEISAFLVMAAKLLQIKSEALLPRPPVREPGEEDLGEELARQLQIYKRFKELANWLDGRVEQHQRTYLRVAPPLKIEGRLDLSDITLADLLAAAESIFSEEADKQALGTVISAPRITIREKISLIAERLGQNPNTSFSSLLGQKPTRLEVVVTFLALLELVKRYRVAARQAGLFTDIQIEKMEDWGKDEEVETEFE